MSFMIYAIIWIGSAWIYWFIWALIWMLKVHASAEFLVFILTKLPTIIAIVDIVLTVIAYKNKQKNNADAPKEEYDRRKHFGTLAWITVAVIVTLLAYICLMVVIGREVFGAH